MKTKRKYFAAVIWLLILSSTSYADGNKLLGECLTAERVIDNNRVIDENELPDDIIGASRCLGFVQGVRNTIQVMSNNSSIKVCMPKGGITNEQATRIVTSYLKKHPASLHEHEVFLTIKAFTDAYPCK